MEQEGYEHGGHQKRPMAVISGPAHGILQGERIALNLIARLSGIATAAKHVRGIADKFGFKGKLAGSRKTSPGLRMFEKYALLIGGCAMHRFDLSSCVMLKDNHIDVAGSITEAVKKARSLAGFTIKIEVECRSLADALEACIAGADIVMLDNFDPEDAVAIAKTVKQKHADTVIVEVSGGIKRENVHLYMDDNVDVISMGSLTQGQSIVDFSLKVTQ